MWDEIKEKAKRVWNWAKRKAKQIAITLGIIGIAYASTFIGNGEVPSIIAEGETIEFNYTDDNTGENFIIRTDKEIYTPLWAWNGFDVYVMVKNESGKSQQVYVSPFFSKDFTIESIAILDPSATTIIKEPIYGQICSATSTECWDEQIGEQDKEVLGRWNTVLSPTFFSEEDYQQFISDNNILVKDKGGRKAKQKFGALFLKNQIVYFKVRLKANEPFSVEEFDLEIIGDKSGYGLLDPTILIEDFNACNDGDLDTNAGCSGWSYVDGDRWQVQGIEVKEGAKSVRVRCSGGLARVQKVGTSLSTGKISWTTWRTVNNTGKHNVELRSAGSFIMEIRMDSNGQIRYETSSIGVTNIQAYNVDQKYDITVEWRTAPSHQFKITIDEVVKVDWLGTATVANLDTVRLTAVTDAGAGQYGYIDYIAEEPYVEVVAVEPQMEVMIIQ